MELVHSIVLGIVEGVTEFLPVSSTAHLILTSRLLGIPQTEFQKFFEVFIQAGAILAIVVLYFQYIKLNKRLIFMLLASFVPTAIIGFLMRDIIKGVFFESFSLIAFSLFFVGVIYLILELMIKQEKIKLDREIEFFPLRDAVIIGLFQSLAIVPGVSRAGAVIVGMMLLRYNREDAALYSFLLAIPTILAASAYDLYKSRHLLQASGNNLIPLIVGFVVSFIVAYFTVKWLTDYLSKHSLVIFGFYRISLAIIVVLLFLL